MPTYYEKIMTRCCCLTKKGPRCSRLGKLTNIGSKKLYLCHQHRECNKTSEECPQFIISKNNLNNLEKLLMKSEIFYQRFVKCKSYHSAFRRIDDPTKLIDQLNNEFSYTRDNTYPEPHKSQTMYIIFDHGQYNISFDTKKDLNKFIDILTQITK